jgi:hypothetical protein
VVTHTTDGDQRLVYRICAAGESGAASYNVDEFGARDDRLGSGPAGWRAGGGVT